MTACPRCGTGEVPPRCRICNECAGTVAKPPQPTGAPPDPWDVPGKARSIGGPPRIGMRSCDPRPGGDLEVPADSWLMPFVAKAGLTHRDVVLRCSVDFAVGDRIVDGGVRTVSGFTDDGKYRRVLWQDDDRSGDVFLKRSESWLAVPA